MFRFVLFLVLPALFFGQPVYESASRRFCDYHSYEQVLSTLRNHGLTLEHRNFFEHVMPHEELGFFGYHSSTQGFRIFQDIIRVVLEEICELEIKKDFHFLRVPGKELLSCQSKEEFFKNYPHVYNYAADQQEQLLSMNYVLFGNFNNFGSCSVFYFTQNRSATSVIFETKLAMLFDEVGLPKEAIQGLFLLGQPLMMEDNAILLQCFDFSHFHPAHRPYELVDRMCYAAVPGGVPDPIAVKLSELYLGERPQRFTQQLRLVINNSDILNPYGPLYIRRLERTDPAVVQLYETRLRQALQGLPYDKEKARAYRQKLLQLWGQSDED